jgi:short-subunit dehydrogenase
MNILKGRCALVTGASSGLGVDFARQLAAMGCQLVLVARREDRLQALAKELRRQHAVDVGVIAMDLTLDGAPEALHRRVGEAGIEVDVLINNAGVGLYGAVLDNEAQRVRNMVRLDIEVPTALSQLFAADMVERGFGYLIQVASIAAFHSSPLYAAYAAAKAYLLHFSEALSFELEGSGVRCTALCPGITRTAFHEASQQPTLSLYQRLVMMESPSVVRAGLRAMLRDKTVVVPGFINALFIWMNRWLPRRWATWCAHRLIATS